MTEVEQLISNILNNYNNFNATPEKSIYDRLDYLHIQFNCISKLYTVVSSIARVGITERSFNPLIRIMQGQQIVFFVIIAPIY